ncbi:MAG: ATP-binding protein [Vicinamibacterales bacterium]
MTPAYEALGLFYLGRQYDLSTRTRGSEPVLYESKDLVTHAVCVGMTGSGKTGLGIGLIEEAAIDGIPVLAIDPKGDLANLALTFPGLTAEEFEPWVDRSMAPDADAPSLAATQADTWRRGLADWDQDGARIARLRSAAEVRVFTPGSRSGHPLALLGSLAPPPGGDAESLAASANGTSAALLALAGLGDEDPQSPERVLLANLLSHAWRAGHTIDLPSLVQQIQRPPFDTLGVLDIDTFYPARDRQALALRFNAVLAAPGFDVWLSGQALDIGALLYTPEGRPRISVVSIAHLPDAERMLVVSLLLGAVLDWTRAQSGTSSLRALIYMDEIFGYLPPSANPPSKLPLLTLLKQARAFGVGLVLATQNPVDLDYKALSNTGTWFLGRLQTERDKSRVLDGLEGAASALDRPTLDRMLSSLTSRVFLLHNVHEAEPVVFQTRWTLSYLRGPMGPDELRRLSADRDAAGDITVPPATRPHAGPRLVPAAAMSRAGTASAVTATVTIPHGGPAAPSRQVLPAGVPEYFVPGPDGHASRYVPALYCAARVHYADARSNLDVTDDLRLLVPIEDGPVAIDWDAAEPAPCAPDALGSQAEAPDARFAPLPAPAASPRSYATWERDFERWILRARPLRLLAAPALRLQSRPGETERDFRIRAQQASREQRDAAVAALRTKHQTRLTRLADRVKKQEDALAREQQQSGQQKLQTAVSIGATVFGALFGRKAASLSTLGRATTAARGMGRSAKEAEDVARAAARVATAQEELETLEADIAREVEALEDTYGADRLVLETVEIKAKRGSVDVQLVALAWTPAGP